MDIEEKYRRVREALQNLANVAATVGPEKKTLRALAFEAQALLSETKDVPDWESSEEWDASSC